MEERLKEVELQLQGVVERGLTPESDPPDLRWCLSPSRPDGSRVPTSGCRPGRRHFRAPGQHRTVDHPPNTAYLPGLILVARLLQRDRSQPAQS